MSSTFFRVHPAINFARVGNSEDYYLAPITAAGEPVPGYNGLYGGLPRNKDTGQPIEEKDLRDAQGNVVRQAAQFSLIVYDEIPQTYPSGAGRPVQIGDIIDGKKVKDIVWTVHLANKKANNFMIADDGEELGIYAYEDGRTPPIRNPDFGPDLAEASRRSKLVIDPGPRALKASSRGKEVAHFDANSKATYANPRGEITEVDYPISFPKDHFPGPDGKGEKLYSPLGEINTLGQMTVTPSGELVVVGGYGRAQGIQVKGQNPPLDDAIDNNGWFDDTSDGIVSAQVIFEGDLPTLDAVPGWVVCTDPSYAPQVRNVVSAWDDMYNTFVTELGLAPDIYKNGKFNKNYKPPFDTEIQPVFHGAMLQQWATSLPQQAIRGHGFMGATKFGDDPTQRIPNFDQLIRNPEDPDNQGPLPGEPEKKTVPTLKMPLSLGDATKSYLTLSPTQYFMMKQWHENKVVETGPKMGIGELLDRNVMLNCLGGRYSPGIDVSFYIRDKHLFHTKWRSVYGPFRINAEHLHYADATPSTPFLGVGYIPLRSEPVQPGDLCKFMALPWHTDYNSCATHLPDPNPDQNSTTYWSWPAQRPVQIYPKDLCTYSGGKWHATRQMFSIRGEGTKTNNPAETGRFQEYIEYMKHWHEVGFVIQGLQVPDKTHGGPGNYGAQNFIEVQSQFSNDPNDSNEVQPWPSGYVDYSVQNKP